MVILFGKTFFVWPGWVSVAPGSLVKSSGIIRWEPDSMASPCIHRHVGLLQTGGFRSLLFSWRQTAGIIDCHSDTESLQGISGQNSGRLDQNKPDKRPPLHKKKKLLSASDSFLLMDSGITNGVRFDVANWNFKNRRFHQIDGADIRKHISKSQTC